MKSKNHIYVAVLAVMVIGFTFFFSTKLWLPDDRIKQNSNYNAVLTVGNWMIKITDAKYDPATKILRCTVYQKTITSDSPPYKLAVYNEDSDDGNVLKSTLQEQKNQPNTRLLEIKNVPADFYYLTVVISASTSSGSASTAVLDEFGQPESSSVSSVISEDKRKVMIDYRVVQKPEKAVSSQAKSNVPSGTEVKKGA